jgi:hypothetical protein
MGLTVATWRLAGLKEAESDIDATLAGIKNILLGGALITSVASAIAGRRIARQAPKGATPVESGTEPAPETPEEAARSQRVSAFLGAAKVALVAASWGSPRRWRSAPWKRARAPCLGSLAEPHLERLRRARRLPAGVFGLTP